MRILYVEDQLSEQTPIVRVLRNQNHEVILKENVFDALEYIKTSEPDILLCDYHLGNGPNGLFVAENTRNLYAATTIVMIRSHLTAENAVQAMQVGADDFLHRPIALADILDRLWKAVTRHQSRYVIQRPSAPTSGPLTLDRQRHIATWNNQPLSLTPIEFALLAQISAKPGQLITFTDLWASVRGERLDSKMARVMLKPHISNLRAKLSEQGAPEQIIRNVRGEGYIWSPGEI